MKGDEPPIDWDEFVPLIAHETKESIVEALQERRAGASIESSTS